MDWKFFFFANPRRDPAIICSKFLMFSSRSSAQEDLHARERVHE